MYRDMIWPNVRQRGFSLIELSIVLVIIALIVGGVVAGKEMIFTARIRGTIGDIDRYLSMVNGFRAKYNCFPGDCAKASTFFGSPDPAGPSGLCGAGVLVNNLIGTGACDGNGDNQIGGARYDELPPWGVGYRYPANYTSSSEPYWLWQHLGRSGFMPDQFSPPVGSIAGHVAGQTVPSTRLRTNLVFEIYYDHVDWCCGYPSWEPPELMGWAHRWYTPPGHYIALVAAPCDSTGCSPSPYQLSPPEAFAIDNKLDDGKPGLGRVKDNNGSGCNIGAEPFPQNSNIYFPMTAMYNVTNTDLACVGLYIRYGE